VTTLSENLAKTRAELDELRTERDRLHRTVSAIEGMMAAQGYACCCMRVSVAGC
jgi:hypothetical protein